MMKRLIVFLLKLLRFPKLYFKKRMFLHNAVFPHGNEGTTFGSTSFCSNASTEEGAGIFIGHHCDILGRISTGTPNAKVTIGDYTTIRYDSVVGAVEKIEIGNHVIISNHVTIYDNNNHPTDPEQRIKMTESGFYSELWNWKYSEHKPVKICDNVWIGQYATVLKGVTIGEGSVVGCNSVVTKDVPPYTVVAGNPARVVRTLR